MKNVSFHLILKALFSVFMAVSAAGELTMNEAVVRSMEVLQMPLYWLYFLGVAKLLGIAAIWLSPNRKLREWAYAGFAFDLLGAIFGFLFAGQLIMPDMVLAPLGLILCFASYGSAGKRMGSGPDWRTTAQ